MYREAEKIRHLPRMWDGNKIMIRKAVIVLFTLASLTMGCVMVWSIFHPTLEYYEWRGLIILYKEGLDLRTGISPLFMLNLHHGSASFEYGRHPTTTTITDIPIWIIFLIFTTYPTVVFILGPLCRWRRRRMGMCLSCGYDLTGNESGTCPECGIEIAENTREPS